MENKNKIWHFLWRICSITLLGTGLVLNVVYADNFTEDKYEAVDNVRESGFMADSFYSVDGDNFTAKIGLKGQDEDVVRFEAYPDKELSGLFSGAPDWLLGQKKGVEFKLKEAIDSGNIDAKIEEIKTEKSTSHLAGVAQFVGDNLNDAWKNISSDLTMFTTFDDKANGLLLNDQEIVNDEVIDEVDLEYSSLDKGLKEEIVVKASEDVFDTYLFEFTLDDNMILHRAAEGNRHGLPVGTYYLADVDHNYIAHFLPLVAYDSNGVETDEVTIDFVAVNDSDPVNEYVIVITVDKDWLADPLLQYPVIIDPTIVHDTQGEFEAGEENRLETSTDPRVELKYHELTADVNTVGLWHFDDSSGQTVSDSSGNGNDGTLGPTSGSETQDPTWNTSGQKLGDSAIEFDGSNDYIKISDDDSLKITDELTIEAWIKGFGDDSYTSSLRRSAAVNDLEMQVVGDKIYYTWVEDDGSSIAQIWTATMDTDGSSWSATKRTTSSYDNFNPHFQVVGSKLYFVFMRYDGSNRQLWTAEMNTNGTGWSETKRTSSSYAKYYHQMQVYGSKIYTAWTEDDGSNWQVWTAEVNTNGSGWSATKRTTSNYYKINVQIHVSNERLHLAWQQSDTSGYPPTGNYQIWSAQMNTDGGDWSATQRTSTNRNTDVQLQITDKKIYYVWLGYDGSNEQIWIGSTDLDGSNWSASAKTSSSYRKYKPQFQIVGDVMSVSWSQRDASNVEQVWTGELLLDTDSWTDNNETSGGTNKQNIQMQVVGVKKYYCHEGNLYTAVKGSNIINRGDFFGIGADAENVYGFINGGLDTLNYLAQDSGYSNGAMSNAPHDSSKWNHVSVVFDGGTINTYLNGVLYGSMTQSMSISSNDPGMSDYPIIIGDHFDGDIDEVRITNRALSPEEIYYDAQLRPYGVYTSDVIDLGADNPTFNSLSWEEYGVRTGDGETDLSTGALVAKWNFNETSGTSASDASGNGHTGTLNSFSNTTGQDVAALSGWTDDNKRWGAGALMFDGSDDYVSVPYDSQLNFSDDFSISAWVKTNQNNRGDIVARFNASSPWSGYALIMETGGEIGCWVGDNAGDYLYGNKKINDGNWHYVSCTHNSGSVKVYVDGALDNSGTRTPSLNETSTGITIGNNSVPNAPFGGTIDSVSLYERELDVDEILSNYQMGQIELQTRTGSDDTPENGGWEAWQPADLSVTAQLDDMDDMFDEYSPPSTTPSQSPTSGLIAYWPMNETSGTNVDETINNNDATAVGADIVNARYSKGREFIKDNSDYLQVSHSSTFNWGSNNYSISMFIRATNKDDVQQIISKAGDSSHRIYMQIYPFSDRTELQCGWDQYTGMWEPLDQMFDNRWHHIVCLRDGATTGKIYYDGELVHTGTGLPNNSVDNTSDLYIGRHTSLGRYLDGTIDDLRIYNRALGSTEIADMAAEGLKELNGTINHTSSSDIKTEGVAAQRFDVGAPLNDYYTVGLWHLDETTGTGAYIKDSSINNFDGTPSGNTVVDGIKSKAQSMSGSSSTIDIAKNASELGLGGDSYKSVEAWVYTRNFNNGGIFGMGNQADAEDFSLRTMGTDNDWRLQFWGTGNDFDFEYESLNKWVYFAVTYDGETARVYADGQLIGQKTITLNTTNTNDFQIGRWYGAYDFDGIIDEVRLSDVARTSQEIAENYRAGAAYFLTRSLASTSDLSSNNKLSIYIASDSPGTHINTAVGESPYVNYQADSNTAGLWYLDEQTADVIDDSGNKNNSINEYEGIEYGLADSNLTFTLNYWNGGSNPGEIDADCPGGDSACYIKTKDGDTISTPDINYGIAVEDGATGDAFVMYSDTDVRTRFTVHTDNSDDFVVVRYNSGWQYNTNSTWSSFTPVDSDILVAQVDLFNGYSIIDYPDIKTTGKIGGGRYFNGESDMIIIDDSSSQLEGTTFSIEAWVKPTAYPIVPHAHRIAGKYENAEGTNCSYGYSLSLDDGSNQFELIVDPTGCGNSASVRANSVAELDQWHYVVGTYNNGQSKIYVNGKLEAESSLTAIDDFPPIFNIGAHYEGGLYEHNRFWEGVIDEIRYSDIVRTPEEIRQAYEVGKRTHEVTIDFGASLDSGNLISGSGDTSFTVDATAYGLSQKGSNLFIGDKIIIRENYDGTEYIAQGTVDSVNQSTGAVTVVSWDSGSTFPSSGYTANADVFKWQKETFDIFGAMPSHVDAVDELSFRFLDGNLGRTFWIDDVGVVENDGLLTNNSGATVTSSPNQYFQYKAILTTTDPDPTPALGPVTLDYEGDLSMTAASTSESYMNTENNTAFNVQCNGVTTTSSGNTVTCYGSWNQSNWYSIGTDTSPLSDATIQGTPDVSGWTGYPTGNGTYTIYARAEENSNYTDAFSFNIEKDMSRPAVTGITSVAGDTTPDYYDTTDDSSTLVVYTADTDAATCKWDESDLTYGAMSNTCTSTTNCTLDLSGEEKKDVYFRCVDTAGNYSDSSYHLEYYIDATAPEVTSITSVAGDTSSPYKDNSDDSSTAVVYSASADATTCKWDSSDVAYASMSNTCTDTSNCDLDLSGEGSKTVYMRCEDAAGLVSTSSYTLNYSIDTTPPTINSITSVAGDTSSPYYDTSDDNSTQILFDVSADADECKWDTSDVAYDSMSNTCSGAGDCTTNLAGDGAKTVYIRCKDDADNKMTSSTQVDYTIDTTPPEVTSITSVEGDTSSPYKDGSDDSDTLVVYTASGDATSCKWDESDVTYGAMANTCTDTSNCTLDLSGEGAKTVYTRCLDSAGLASTTSYQLDYSIDVTPPTINSITSVAGDASSPYYDTSDDSFTQILFDVSADANECKWDASDVAYDSMVNTCGAAGDCTADLSGDGAKTVYIRCKDDVENKMTSSYQVDYTVDSTPPEVSGITSVAGDTSSPYNDGTDDSSTAVVYTASADAVSCRWDEVDQTYGTMANVCADTSNCDLDLTGEGAHTVYMRCIDSAGLMSTSSYQLDYNIDTTAPNINSITSVAGDVSSPYKDGTDDSSTLVVYTSDSDAVQCKWNTTDTDYDSMANICSSTSNCTLDLSGDGSKTVYMRCEDEVGNKASSSYQLDYEIDSAAPTINSITSVAGDTTSPYYDTTDDGSTQILFDVSTDATACKWSTSDQAYDSMPNTCTDAGDCTTTLSGQGAKTVYIRCTDDVGNKMTSSQQVDYTIDSIVPSVTSVTSVAGDPEAPYLDIEADDESLIVYTASADAVACRWHNVDVAYDSMTGMCESTTNCTVPHSSDGAKTVFMRCEDAAGNKSTNSYQVDFDVDEIIGGGGTTTLLETSAPGDSGVIQVTLTPDMTVPVVNGSIKIRLSSDYSLAGLTEDDVYATGGDVTWTNNEIIYQDGVKINYHQNWWDRLFKAKAAGENSIVFPFTGSLSDADGQLSFVISSAENPSGTGPQSVVYDIFSSNNGTGTPLEEGDGVVHINYLVIVTAEIESQLTFNINPVSSGQLVNGETTNIGTTSNLIDFGTFTTDGDRVGAHDLVISTNATDGYVTTIEFDQSLASASNYIPDFPATNTNPITWIAPPGSGTNGYFGYTTNDNTLLTTPVNRFEGGKWSGFSTVPYEVAYDSDPVENQTTRVGYRLNLLNGQDIGTYTTRIKYICTPTY